VVAPQDADEAGNELRARGFATAGGAAWLKTATETGPPPRGAMFIRGTGTPPPPGISDFWLSGGDLQDGYEQLLENWSEWRHLKVTDPDQAIVARILLIHDWRRIILRDPLLPVELLPPGWPGETARDLVASIYHGVLPGSEAWLESAGLPAPVNRESIEGRFKVLRNLE
jgi:phenylacetic acid degradation operon negative regulatory protein